MKTHTTETEIIIEVREDQAGDIIATGYGRAVPYGEPTDIGGFREQFDRDAFDPAQAVGRPFAYRHGEPIGIITAAENQPDGLYVTFDIVNTAQGRDAATLMRTGSSRGLSVGFAPTKSIWSSTKDAVRHARALLLEVSQTHMPAYASAGVSAIREEEAMSETTISTTEVVVEDAAAREQIADVRAALADLEARAFTAPTVHPLAEYRSFGDYRKAVWAGEVENRALFDQVTGDNPGVIPPAWIQEVKGIVDLGRRAINSLGGPMNPGTSGMTVNWPYFDGDLTTIVEEQADEKDEVNSVQISLLKGDANLTTYAAGSDISYQLLQRSSPSYLDAHGRIMAASYAVVTDRAFTSALWNDGTGLEDYDFAADTDGQDFRAAVFSASVTVEDATGQPASVCLVSSDVFRKIGAWSTFNPAAYPVSNVSGTFNAASLTVSVAGLPVVRAPWLDTNAAYNAIVTNGLAARWMEDGPRLATVENVAQLGRDVAIYGYAASALFIPAGVVRVFND